MDLAPAVGTDVPAKLPTLVIWERGGPKLPTVLCLWALCVSGRDCGLDHPWWLPHGSIPWHRGLYRKVTCCQRGFHLRGFTFLWVTPTEFQGSPNHSLLPSRLGKGSVRLAGCGDGSLQPFP